MLLTALWSGECRSQTSLPTSLRPIISAFPFHIELLEQDSLSIGRFRILLAGDAVALDLPLGDAICDVLDVSLPDEAIIATISPKEALTQSFAYHLAAEILHTLVTRMACQTSETTLFDWALRSLAAGWQLDLGGTDTQITQRVDHLLAQVLGFPAERARQSMGEFLTLCDPSYEYRQPDIGLASRLAQTATLAEWQDELLGSYFAASRHAALRVLPG